MPFVTEGGFGSFSKDPAKIADTVSSWLRDDELLARMSTRAKEASRPQVREEVGEGGSPTRCVTRMWGVDGWMEVDGGINCPAMTFYKRVDIPVPPRGPGVVVVPLGHAVCPSVPLVDAGVDCPACYVKACGMFPYRLWTGGEDSFVAWLRGDLVIVDAGSPLDLLSCCLPFGGTARRGRVGWDGLGVRMWGGIRRFA